MKRIIEIDEQTFNEVINNTTAYNLFGDLVQIVVDSTPIPEHHGKIIDADEFWDKIPDIDSPLQNNFTSYEIQSWINETKAIIEKE